MARRLRRNPDNQILRTLFLGVCIVAFLGFSYFAFKAWKTLSDMPDVTLVEKYEPIEAIQLFDRTDHLITTLEGDEDRRVVPLNQISSQMQQAMLAAEDHHFYEHHGVNLASIFRAFIVNMQAGHVVEGGSTITQQLVKNLFFSEGQRTIDRKLKEALMAYELEMRYPKDKILEMYLNQVYFGSTAYGIERAAYRYFDKPAAQLNLAESAFLAGLVKAPSELGTSGNRPIAIARQKEIIDKMVEYGYITPAQGKAARAYKLAFKNGGNPLQKHPYYVSYVLELLRNRFSQSEMRREGLRVYTNLDPQAQDIAESVLNREIAKAPKGVTQAALVTESVQDGAVLALVGGVGDFWKNQFNRATNPHTAGSSFKPFVYLTAFNKGVVAPESIIDDSPLVIKQLWGLPPYAPKDFDHKWMGKITIRKALALSRNVPSVRVAQLTGVDSIVETARLAGITSKLDPNLSLALGSSAVSPIDMATAYATFARFGVMTTPQVIRRIENNKGQVIEVFETKSDKVFPVEPVARLVDVLQDVIKYGTGTMARLDDRPVAGKTGTADAAKDIWFIGFTPDMVTALWAGNDENLPIPGSHVTGGSVMAKIWKEYAKAYYEAHPTPPGSFIAPTALAKSDIPTVDQDASPMVLPGLNGVNPQLPPDALPKNEPTAPFTSAPTPGADGMPPTAPSITPQATPNSEAISVSPGAIKRDTPKPAPDFRSSPSSTTIMPDTSNSSTSNGSSGTSGVSSRRYYPYNQQTKYLPAQPASAPSPN